MGMGKAIEWIIGVVVLVIFLLIALSVITGPLQLYIANATGINATVLPFVEVFVVIGVFLIIVYGAMQAAGIKIGGK
jgi:hypothetical protein